MEEESAERQRPAQLPDAQAERALVAALRERKGRATVGDLVVATGVPKLQVEDQLRAMLGRYKSHLAVDDQGELLYLFDPALRPRDEESKLSRLLRRAAIFAWWLFTLFCKVGVMVVLVAYFVIFVVLAIAAVIGVTAGGGKDSRRRDSGALGGLLQLILRVTLEFFIITESRRSDYRRRQVPARPFYKKVFSFAFGPEAAEHWGLPGLDDPRAFERGLLGVVRRLLGVLSPTEMIRYTGWSLQRADEESTRLLVEFEGEPIVTDEGQLLYRFPGLLASAGGQRGEQEARPWYRETEPDRTLTGNTAGTNTLIGFMNGFNLLAAGGLTWAIFIDRSVVPNIPVPYWSLTWIPLFFSVLLFAVPIARSFTVAAENRRRRRRNVRRALLSSLFQDVDRGREPRLSTFALPPEALRAAVGRNDLVTTETERLLRDLEGEPEADGEGRLFYRFPRLLADLQAAQQERKRVDPASLKLGEIVYSSAD